MKQYISETFISNLLAGLLVLIITFILVRLVSKLGVTVIEKNEKNQMIANYKTYIMLFFQIVKILIVAFAVLVMLQVMGVNVSSVIAGLGITSAVMALAVQDIAKDFIQGFRIIVDGFFKVGDFIRYNGEDYQVTLMTMRTTELKAVNNNNVVYVSNRNITEVTRLSGIELLPFSIPYEADSDKVMVIINNSIGQINGIKGISDARCTGIRGFGESGVEYVLVFTCKPSSRFVCRSAVFRIIKDNMEKEGIFIPYNKVEIVNAQ